MKVRERDYRVIDDRTQRVKEVCVRDVFCRGGANKKEKVEIYKIGRYLKT